MKSVRALFLLFAMALTALALSAGNAFAVTAANTQITNAAKLTYSGGVPVTASVSVTVALVPSTPNVGITAGPTVAYTGTNSPKITDTVTITATANGPAQYTVTPAISSASNSTGSSVATGGTMTIGATVTTGTSGQNFVTVPAGQVSGGTVNGIGGGSTIVFTVNGHTYTITNVAVADNGDSTYKISWSGQTIPAADVPGVGVLVAEQKTVSLDVLPGTFQTAGTDIVVKVNATVSTAGAADAKTSDAVNTWTTINSNPSVTLTKYVRNVYSPVVGSAGATSITINGSTSTYYTAGVTGKPSDTLEYVLIANNTGAVDLAGSAISDLVPVNFVNFVTGVYNSKDIFYIDATGASFSLPAGATGQASYVTNNNPNLVVNVGAGATALAGGTIPAGKSVTIAYQATIR